MAWLVSPTGVFWLGSLCAAFGLVFLILGIRGRLVSRAPHCRGCGFELTGLPEPLVEQVCPECGSRLDATKHAIRSGRRRRRAGVMAAGMLLLLVGVGGLGAIGWGRASGFNWNTIKPVWLLEREVLYGTYNTADAAANEVLQRITGLKSTSPEIAPLVSLAVQMEEARADAQSISALGDAIGLGFAMGLVSKDEYADFVERAIDITLVARDRLRVGQPIVYNLVGKYTNRTDMESLSVRVLTRSIQIDGIELKDEAGSSWGDSWQYHYYNSGFGAGTFSRSGKCDKPIPDGAPRRGELCIGYDLKIIDPAQSGSGGYGKNAVVAVRPATLCKSIELVGTETPLLSVTREPSAGELSGHFTIEQIEEGGVGDLEITVENTDSPVSGAFDVLIVDSNGDEHKLRASVLLRAGANRHGYRVNIGRSVRLPQSGPITMILRSNLGLAEQQLGFDEAWIGDLVYQVDPELLPQQTKSMLTPRTKRPSFLPELGEDRHTVRFIKDHAATKRVRSTISIRALLGTDAESAKNPALCLRVEVKGTEKLPAVLFARPHASVDLDIGPRSLTYEPLLVRPGTGTANTTHTTWLTFPVGAYDIRAGDTIRVGFGHVTLYAERVPWIEELFTGRLGRWEVVVEAADEPFVQHEAVEVKPIAGGEAPSPAAAPSP